jgi:hypothetical protein
MRVPQHLMPRCIDRRQQSHGRIQRLTQFLAARPREEVMLWQWLNKRESYHAAQLMPDAPELIVPWLSIPVTAQPLAVSALHQPPIVKPQPEDTASMMADGTDEVSTPSSMAISSPPTVCLSATDEDRVPLVDSETWQQSLMAGSVLYDMAHANDESTASNVVEDVIPSSFIPINEWKASPLDDDQAIYARLLEAHDYLSRQQAFRHRLANTAADCTNGYDIVLTPGASMRSVSVNASGQVIKGNNGQQPKQRKRRAKTDGDGTGGKPGPKPGKRQKKGPMAFKLWTEHEQLVVMQALMKDVRQRLDSGPMGMYFDLYLDQLVQRWKEVVGEPKEQTFELTLPHLFELHSSQEATATASNPSAEESEKENNKSAIQNTITDTTSSATLEEVTKTQAVAVTMEEPPVKTEPQEPGSLDVPIEAPTTLAENAAQNYDPVAFRAQLQDFVKQSSFDAALLRSWMTASLCHVEQPSLRESAQKNEASIDTMMTGVKSVVESEAMQSCLSAEEMMELKQHMDAALQPFKACRDRGEDVLHRLELALHRIAVYARCMPPKMKKPVASDCK